MNFHWIILFLSFIGFSHSCNETPQKPVLVIPGNNQIKYEGRIELQDSAVHLFWSGTQIEINFKGTEISGFFQDSEGKNFYNVIVDNDSLWILQPSIKKEKYRLASGLKDTIHNLKIYKRTEWNRGTTTFYGFHLPPGTQVHTPPVAKKRKMEFYGNSITAGYGIEDYSGSDRSDSIFTNNYMTYAAITARHFGAQSHYIVRSGIGIMMSFVENTMPEIYNRTNPHRAESVWDFSVYQPDVVVVNLFQNDSWLVKMPQSEEYKKRFGNEKIEEDYIITAYVHFIEGIRHKYNNAAIICMLGNMSIMKKGTKWPGYIMEAVNRFNDENVYTLFVPYKKSFGHPRREEQKEMADKLIRFIDENIMW